MVLNKEKKSSEIWFLLSVLFIIYITDSLMFATNSNSLFIMAKRFLPILVAAFLLLKVQTIDLTIILVSFSILLSAFFAGKILDGYFYFTEIGLLIFAYYYSKLVSFEKFADMFIKLMRIIAIVSLFGFAFSSIIRQASFIPTIINTVGNTYKTLILTSVPTSASLARRNVGPFWEPGAYQFYLNMALLFTVYRKPKKWMLDALLFSATAVTTMSGAAILPIPFILIAFFWDARFKHADKYIAFALMLTVSIVVLYYAGLFDEILVKLSFAENESNSAGFRIGSAIANIRSTLAYPLFGASPEYQDAIRAEVIESLNGHSTEGNTNTFFGFFSYFGIFVGSYFAYRLYKFTSCFSDKTFSRISIFLAIFLATSNENFITSIILIVFMFLKKEGKTEKI